MTVEIIVTTLGLLSKIIHCPLPREQIFRRIPLPALNKNTDPLFHMPAAIQSHV